MKIVITPAKDEVAHIYSDFKQRQQTLADSYLIISCGYGSKYDMSSFHFDLCDKDLNEILDFLKPKLQFDIDNYRKDY